MILNPDIIHRFEPQNCIIEIVSMKQAASSRQNRKEDYLKHAQWHGGNARLPVIVFIISKGLLKTLLNQNRGFHRVIILPYSCSCFS